MQCAAPKIVGMVKSRKYGDVQISRNIFDCSLFQFYSRL